MYPEMNKWNKYIYFCYNKETKTKEIKTKEINKMKLKKLGSDFVFLRFSSWECIIYPTGFSLELFVVTVTVKC